jgi:hypothetical protein
MERWIAVRASAVFSIAGSVVTLLFAGMMLIAVLAMPPRAAGPFPPAVLQTFGGMAALMFAGFGVWGIATGVAIFRRRGWARISILTFAAMVVFFGLTGLAAMMLISQPDNPAVNARLAMAVRRSIEAFYVALALMGAWWLALFNRRSTRNYFAEGGGKVDTARPLSISAIGYYLLAGAAATALCATLRVPALFFGAVIAGWGAAALYSAYTAVQVYLGSGLLQLDRKARIWAIVYFAIAGANALVFTMGPKFASRMNDLQGRFENVFNREMTVFPGGPGLALIGAAAAVLPIWFLVRRRPAFMPETFEAKVRQGDKV